MTLLAVAGCGGSNKPADSNPPGTPASSASSPATPGGPDFVTRANALCSDSNRQIGALPAPRTRSETAATLTQGLTIARATLNRLRVLTPPPEKQAAFAKYLADVDGQIGLGEQAASALGAGDYITSNGAEVRAKALKQVAHGEATSLGLTECTKSTRSGGGTAPGSTGASSAPATGPGGGSLAKSSYSTALSAYQRDESTYNSTYVGDSKAKNLLGEDRDAYTFSLKARDFDAALRKIAFPARARPNVNALLSALYELIAKLDTLAHVGSQQDADAGFFVADRLVLKVDALAKRLSGG